MPTFNYHSSWKVEDDQQDSWNLSHKSYTCLTLASTLFHYSVQQEGH